MTSLKYIFYDDRKGIMCIVVSVAYISIHSMEITLDVGNLGRRRAKRYLIIPTSASSLPKSCKIFMCVEIKLKILAKRKVIPFIFI